jgi:hypothetical protein
MKSSRTFGGDKSPFAYPRGLPSDEGLMILNDIYGFGGEKRADTKTQ